MIKKYTHLCTPWYKPDTTHTEQLGQYYRVKDYYKHLLVLVSVIDLQGYLCACLVLMYTCDLHVHVR